VDPIPPACNAFLDIDISQAEERGGPVTLTTAEVEVDARLECAGGYWFAEIWFRPYIVDRTPGYDGRALGTSRPFEHFDPCGPPDFDCSPMEADADATVVDEWDDNGRQVEGLLEIILVVKPSLFKWNRCEAPAGLRLVSCEGKDTNRLHAVVGTHTYSTGLKAPVARHVALGDSYGAGNGAEHYRSDAPGCFRSMVGYHYLVTGAQMPGGIPVQEPTVRSCSGADIVHMSHLQVGTEGPQLAALDRKTTRLVTLSVGGNDLGFGDWLRQCADPAVTCPDPIVTFAKNVETTRRLQALYREILDRIRPDGTLIVLGYPAVFPRPGEPTCQAVSGLPPVPPMPGTPGTPGITIYDQRELGLFDTAWRDARDVLFRATNPFGARVKFVDMYDALAGHRMCSDDPWAVAPTHSFTPPEWVHPNAQGHAAMARRVRQAIAQLPRRPFDAPSTPTTWSSVALGPNADGRLELFGVDTTSGVGHRWQTSPSGGVWSDWTMFDGNLETVAAEANADGRLELFGTNSAGQIYHRSQTSPNGTWSPWEQVGGILNSIALARNADGRLEAFGTNPNGNIYHQWQTSPNSSTWSPWVLLDGLLSKITAERNADGRLELFGTNSAGTIYHRYQTSPNGTWSPWEQVGGILNSIALARNADGRLEVFGTNSAGHIYHSWQTSPNSSNWSPWVLFDGLLSKITAERNADGRLELFGTNSAGQLYHQSQTSPNSSTWSGWVQLHGDANR
jgi:hypothetical protein